MVEIIAETAFSHEGDFNYLKQQIKSSHSAKADYIKFQVFLNSEEYFTDSHPSLNTISSFMFSEKQWLKAFLLAKELGLKILVLPLNISSLVFCEKHSALIDIYEVHSVCFNEYMLLNYLSKINKKIVLGIGGRLPQEIYNAKKLLNKSDDDIILMYGFQSFPTDKNTINLLRINEINKKFNNKIGYADHSSFDCNYLDTLNTAAVSLGACYIEKHIVVEIGKKRTDYETALDSDFFKNMVLRLREIELILGNDDIYKLNEKEILYRNREKQIVSSKDIKIGEKLSLDNLTFKISQEKSDFEQMQFEDLIGSAVKFFIAKDNVIKSKHINKIND